MLVSEFINNFLLGDFYTLLRNNETEFSDILQKRALLAFNSGMLRVYTDFGAAHKGLTLVPIEGRTTYPLLKKHAYLSETNDAKFIDDRNDKFLEDVGEVVMVHDQYNRMLSLNNQQDLYSAYLPSHNVLQLPASSTNSDRENKIIMYSVVYKPLPVELSASDSFYVNPALQDALRLYMAHRLTIGEQDEMRKNREYLARYKEEVARIKLNNFDNSSLISVHDNIYKFGI